MLRESDNYRVDMEWNGTRITTLRTILPKTKAFKALFVGKRPSPESVAEGHYFRGNQGLSFWNRLREYGILDFDPLSQYPDDRMVRAGFGITDIVKTVAKYTAEPRSKEYDYGVDKFLNDLRLINPRVIVFIYKKVLDEILKRKARSGFVDLTGLFAGAKVYVFPVPGTYGVRQGDIARDLSALRDYLRKFDVDGTEIR
ncbi:MAG: uracil-DNA glycosylase family protein [Bacillota bacterium]